MTLSLTRAAAPAPAPHSTERQKLAQAAKQFEALVVRQMLSAARKADFGGDILGGQGMDTFRTMQDERFADIAAETGAFGMARMIEAQLAKQVVPQSPLPPAGGGVERRVTLNAGGNASPQPLVTSPPLTPPAGGKGTGGPARSGREL